jgi:hypothetical protein
MGSVINDETDDRQADERKAHCRCHRLSIALELLAILNRSPVCCRGCRFKRQLRNEILDRAIGIETNFLRVSTDKRPGEDAAGQPRQIAALERFEGHHGNPGSVR